MLKSGVGRETSKDSVWIRRKNFSDLSVMLEQKTNKIKENIRKYLSAFSQSVSCYNTTPLLHKLPWSGKTNKVKKECYLMRQNNTIYKFSIKLSFSSIGQEKSKLQKQKSKLLILNAMAVWCFSLLKKTSNLTCFRSCLDVW